MRCACMCIRSVYHFVVLWITSKLPFLVSNIPILSSSFTRWGALVPTQPLAGTAVTAVRAVGVSLSPIEVSPRGASKTC